MRFLLGKNDKRPIGKIERIIWYNKHDIKRGFNYSASPESYEWIKNSGISLEIVSSKSDVFSLESNYLYEVKKCNSIYSIIGAKMGIRAMEFFNVGVNNVYVTSFAGNTPPLSCFNDGVQISSGATIGQGLIRISDSISTIPSAIFDFNNRKVNIAVKEDIEEI